MIVLHRQDATRILINPRCMATAERSHAGEGTIVTMASGRTIHVSETVPEIGDILDRDFVQRFINRNPQTRE